MRIFPIYESSVLTNPKGDSCKYEVMSADNAHIIICFHNGVPINIRWTTDEKEKNNFIKTIKKTFTKYEEHKENTVYCNYPDPKEDIPF